MGYELRANAGDPQHEPMNKKAIETLGGVDAQVREKRANVESTELVEETPAEVEEPKEEPQKIPLRATNTGGKKSP